MHNDLGLAHLSFRSFLQKTLEFTNIDKYHGTGAFNITNYPRWDSFFFENVDRPMEIMVMAMKQRQRRRSSLSGHNSYLENMSGSPQPSSMTPPPQQLPPQQPPAPRRGFGGSYLDGLSGASEAPKMKKKDYSIGNSNSAPRGSVGNYLDQLSSNIQQSSSDGPKAPMQDQPSDNPFVEEVRLAVFVNVLLLLLNENRHLQPFSSLCNIRE